MTNILKAVNLKTIVTVIKTKSVQFIKKTNILRTQWCLELARKRFRGNASLLLNNFFKPKSNNARWIAIE